MQFFSAVRNCVALLAALIALPAFADIAAFNAAIKKNDYKAAAAEAQATWPTLDKSREDIGVIAGEFAFASYVAGAHAAAKTFAEFAAGKHTEAQKQGPAGLPTMVLLRLAEHRLAPSMETRNRLAELLAARAALPGIEAISYLGADALVAFDIDAGRWKDAQASADLAIKLATAGGGAYATQRRRFELFAAIAAYGEAENPEVYQRFATLQRMIAEDIDAAPSDEAAKRFLPVYWEVNAWRETVGSHIRSKGRDNKSYNSDAEFYGNPGERRARLLHRHPDADQCRSQPDMRNLPQYPTSALFGGRGYVGAVVLQIDIDERGRTSNPKILAAVPNEVFGEAVLKAVPGLRFKPGKTWDKVTCSLADNGRVINFTFELGR